MSTIKAAYAVTKATLAPYTVWIKPILYAAIAGILFVSGCNYGKNDQKADIVRLSGQVQAYERENKEFKELADRARVDAAIAVKASEKQKKAAEEAAKRAAASAVINKERADEAQRALDEALKDPKCFELLEMKVCKTIPIP